MTDVEVPTAAATDTCDVSKCKFSQDGWIKFGDNECAYGYNYKSSNCINGFYSLYSLNTLCSLFSINGFFILFSINCLFCIGSLNSVFSIMSSSSTFSILSQSSLFSIGCKNGNFEICYGKWSCREPQREDLALVERGTFGYDSVVKREARLDSLLTWRVRPALLQRMEVTFEKRREEKRI